MKAKAWFAVVAVAVSQTVFGFMLSDAREGGQRDPASQPDAGPAVKRIGKVYTYEHRLYTTGDSVWTTRVNRWVEIPGTRLTLDVPQNFQALFTGRFTGESLCSGEGRCAVRVFLNGINIEMHPDAGPDLTFDTAGDDGWESHSIEHVSNNFGNPGRWEMWLEARAIPKKPGAPKPSFSIDNWTFVGSADY